MLRPFLYSLVRFVPDVARGEAVNLGVLVADDEAGAVKAAFYPDARRKMRPLAPGFNLDAFAAEIGRFRERVTTVYQPALTGPVDPRISTSTQLTSLSDTMRNQLQVSPPRVYRAETLDAAVQALYRGLVQPIEPVDRPLDEAHRDMPLKKLRALIWRTIKDWGQELKPRDPSAPPPAPVQIIRRKLEEAKGTRHFADFWLEVGEPVAALIAIPENPGERDMAWARRDSVPTIATEFRRINPGFTAVAVFPPNGHEPTPFVAETRAFLQDRAGVLVARADELPGLRDRIVPSLLTPKI
jgi:Protein of unknown function (DUF3037)